MMSTLLEKLHRLKRLALVSAVRVLVEHLTDHQPLHDGEHIIGITYRPDKSLVVNAYISGKVLSRTYNLEDDDDE
jgi:hypothetical protein